MVWHGFQTMIYVRKIWNNLTSYYDRRLPSSRWESWWRSWLWPGTERQSQRTTDDMTSSFRTCISCVRAFFPIRLLRSFLLDSWKKLLVLIWPLIKTFQTSSRSWPAGQANKARFLFSCLFLFQVWDSLKLLRSGNKSAKQARLQSLEMDTLQHFGPRFCSCSL